MTPAPDPEPGQPVVVLTLGTMRPALVIASYPGAGERGEHLVEWLDDHERARFTPRYLRRREP